MRSVTTSLSDSADRIHMIADVASALAKACIFSRDAEWFWKLAEVEVDQYYELIRSSRLRVRQGSRERRLERNAIQAFA
jgi:hypothetical protein